MDKIIKRKIIIEIEDSTFLPFTKIDLENMKEKFEATLSIDYTLKVINVKVENNE